uniref:Wsv442-like protein n=1 Tax=Metopaulias depressus WSSV-like virus TaxID=1675544 RepID=A0A0K0VL86_9VIRU|nr:wsv442-like protein [Metopaulias depressus WSSV-like virus]
MHGYDSGHVSGFGKIITRPGIVLPLTEENDVVAFGARGDSTTVLLTTDNVEFERIVFKRRKAIRQLLKSHANWDGSPVVFMSELANAATGSPAMAQSAISDIRFDTGTCLFQDDMFVQARGEKPQPPVIAWRRICSPILDQFSENYIVKQLSSIMTSFKIHQTSAAATEERRRIVASAVSVLAATAALMMHLTNGQLTYIPEGHYVYITMPKQRDFLQEKNEANLVINDPTGAGWRILDGDTQASVSGNIVSRLETLMEFSCKCVVDAIIKNGMDNIAMKKIVDSMSASSYVYSSSCLKIGYPKMAVTTSGNSTVNGVGSLTVIAENGQRHTQIPLSEFRVDVVTAEGIAINIEPRIDGDEGSTSPSILQWYNIHQTASQQNIKENEGEKGEEEEPVMDDVWENIPVFPISAPKQWRACKISDKVFNEETWRSKLVRLHKFDWTCKKNASTTQYRSVLNRIAAAVAIITQKTFNDRSVSNDEGVRTIINRCAMDAKHIDENLINATTLLYDIYGFGTNKNRPIVALEKFKRGEGEKEEGDGEDYVITLVGNAPSAASVRAIRMLKQKNYSSHIKMFEKEMLRKITIGEECSSACKWYGVSPTTVLRYPSNESYGGVYPRRTACGAKRRRLSKDKTMFLFTPRCFYHTSASYVHLYADSEGPFDLVKFNPGTKNLTIGNNNGAAATSKDIPGQVIASVERPLIVAAVAADSKITVNDFQTARSLGMTSVSSSSSSSRENEDEEENEEEEHYSNRIISLKETEPGVKCRSFNTNNKIINIELSLPFHEEGGEEEEEEEQEQELEKEEAVAAEAARSADDIEVKCTSPDYYKCPSETAILKYGINNPFKRKTEDRIRNYNNAFLALAL